MASRIQLEERFELRDSETKVVKKKFRKSTAACLYLSSMNFGLSNFYEVWDSKTGKVAFKYIKNDRGHNKLSKIKDGWMVL